MSQRLLALGMHALRPGARYHTTKHGYAVLVDSYNSDRVDGTDGVTHAQHNAQFGAIPAEQDLLDAGQAEVDAVAAETNTDKGHRNSMRQLVKSPDPADLAECIQQIRGLKRALRRVMMKQIGLADGNE